MRPSWICLPVCASLLAVLTGCGGSSSGTTLTTGGNPQTVAFTFTGGTPTAAAVQTGTGTFSSATLQGSALNVSVPSDTTNYSIAYVCPVSNGSTSEFVIQASTKDGSAFSLSCYGQTMGSISGTADATAIPGAANILIYGGSVYSGSVGSTDGTFNFNLPSGNVDIAAVAVDSSIPANVLAVKILRSQTIPGALNGGAPVVFQTSDEVSLQPITVSNVPSGFYNPPFMTVYYFTSNGTIFLLNNNNSPTQSPILPAGAVASGDFYEFISDTIDTATQNSMTSIGQNIAAGNLPSTVALSLPAVWSPSAPSAAQFPSFTFSYPAFSGATTTAFEAYIGWQTGSTTFTGISVTSSANFQNGSTTVTIPDLTSIAGFSQAAASGTPVSWQATVAGGSALPFAISTLTSGSFESVQNKGTYTEP